MKENKRLFYFAIIISILSLGISTYLNFKVKTEVAIYISGIMLNIFAGSIILVGTSLIYYFSERRKLFHSIMNQCLLLRNTFNDIEYLEDISYCSFEEYYEYYKNQEPFSKMSMKEIKKLYASNKENHEEKIYSKMEKIMKAYLVIDNLDLTEFYTLYDSLDFIFSKKKKIEIYNMLFGYTKELRDKIREKAYHFNIYFNSVNGNKVVNYQFVRKLQENLFYYEEQKLSNRAKWKKDLSECNYSCYYDNIKDKAYITSNEIIEYYNQLFVQIGKIAYFDKKYNG